MKSLIPLSLLGLLLSAGGSVAGPAHEYWFLLESADHTMADFIDAKSITSQNHGLKRAWVVAYHAAKSKEYPGDQMSLMIEFNCRTGQSRSLQVAVNDIHGEPVRSLAEDHPGGVGLCCSRLCW